MPRPAEDFGLRQFPGGHGGFRTHPGQFAAVLYRTPAGLDEYDIRGRKTRVVDPDQGETKIGYNQYYQVETVTDAENRTVAYAYDALARRTSP